MSVVRSTISALAAVTLIALFGSASAAHEFWIAPERNIVGPGGVIKADLKVGRMLKGTSYPYLSNRFKTFSVTVGGKTSRVAGSEGDIPAFSQVANRSGLHVIAHQTVDFRVTYDDWAVFRRYLSDEGLDGFAELHRTRGLPKTGFAERYRRYAKALVQVGPVQPADRDRRIGMPLELVAEANPHATGAERIAVKLLWQGAPVANRQINIFRNNGAVTRTSVITDKDGRAMIPLPSDGDYLLNAVLLQPVEDSPVVWSSHWATLSFSLRRQG